MTAGFLNESGDVVATTNEREISGCPLCGKAPFLAEDEHFSFRLYCGEHQNIRTLWYSSLEKAEIEWDRIVKNHPINHVDEFTDRAGNGFSRCPCCQEVPTISYNAETNRYRVQCAKDVQISTYWKDSYDKAKETWELLVAALTTTYVSIKSHEESMSAEGENEVVHITGASIINDPDRARTCPICGNKPIFRTGKTAAGEPRFALHCNKHRQANNELFRTEWHEDPYEAFNEWISVCTKEEEKVHNELTDFLKE